MQACFKTEKAIIPSLLIYNYILRPEHLPFNSVHQTQAFIIIFIMQNLNGNPSSASSICRIFVCFVHYCPISCLSLSIYIVLSVCPSRIRCIKRGHKVHGMGCISFICQILGYFITIEFKAQPKETSACFQENV